MLTEVSILLVAILWGVTNPFIKKVSDGIQKIDSNNPVVRTFLEVKFLFTNYKFLVPFSINQLGSLLYFVTLQTSSLSLMVPVTNSLTFLVTSLTSVALREKLPNKNTIIGMSLICLGAGCCFLDKL